MVCAILRSRKASPGAVGAASLHALPAASALPRVEGSNSPKHISKPIPIAVHGSSLDLRLETCVRPMLGLSSDAATTIDTMLVTLNTRTCLAEATPVASALPCRQSFDPKRRSGDVLALSGRHA